MTPYVRALEHIHNSGTVVDFETLQHVMKTLHCEVLKRYEWKCRELRISVLDVFLGLVHLPIESIWDVQLDPSRPPQLRVVAPIVMPVDVVGKGYFIGC